MAKTVIETAVAIADVTQVRIAFSIADGEGTLKSRLEASIVLPVVRDDGRPSKPVIHTDDLSGLSAALKDGLWDLLKDLYTDARVAEGLD